MNVKSTFNFFIFSAFALGVTFAWNPPAQAADYEPVLGKWNVVTKMGARDSESLMEFSIGPDGTLKGLGSGRGGGGSIDLNDVTFDGKTLSWKLTVQGNIIPVSVEVDGDTFAGAAITPLGNLPVNGSRFDEAAASAAQDRLMTLVGDWELTTEFKGNTVQNKMRIRQEEDGDIGGTILMVGSRTTIHEFHLDGDQLTWHVGLPLISSHPAEARATLNESGTYFEGVVKSAAGDIPIRGGLVDTTKLVVAPYDNPAMLLGAWQVVTSVDGADVYNAVITFSDTPERLLAMIEAEGGVYEANAVNYHIVNEKLGMASARIHVDIPELSPKELVFEMIISNGSFEGEELYSNGRIVIAGDKLE